MISEEAMAKDSSELLWQSTAKHSDGIAGRGSGKGRFVYEILEE